MYIDTCMTPAIVINYAGSPQRFLCVDKKRPCLLLTSDARVQTCFDVHRHSSAWTVHCVSRAQLALVVWSGSSFTRCIA